MTRSCAGVVALAPDGCVLARRRALKRVAASASDVARATTTRFLQVTYNKQVMRFYLRNLRMFPVLYPVK